MRFRGNLQLVEVVGFVDLVQFSFRFLSTIDGDTTSQSSKESLDAEEGGKMGFLEEYEEAVYPPNS